MIFFGGSRFATWMWVHPLTNDAKRSTEKMILIFMLLLLPNGHLEFRRVSDVNSEVWFAQLFVMRPQSDDFNRLDVFQNLIHQSMLYIDATRTCASQISN